MDESLRFGYSTDFSVKDKSTGNSLDCQTNFEKSYSRNSITRFSDTVLESLDGTVRSYLARVNAYFFQQKNLRFPKNYL
jgi:hypothetical protein